MNRASAKFTLWVLAIAVLSAGALHGQGRGPNSLQPDLNAVFFTMVLQRDTPVSRGHELLLPSPSARPSLSSQSSGSAGATNTSAVGAFTLTNGTSSYSVGATVTPTTTQPEAEEEIAADPSDTLGDNLVSAISDFSQPSGFNFTKWALSTNGGDAWIENFVPYDSTSGLLLTSDGHAWDANSDPVLAFDRSGNVFLSDLYITLDSLGRVTAEGLYVSTDTFTNLQTGSFGHTNPVLTNLHNGKTFNIEDKPWITVDNTSLSTAGYVYASWSHFTGCQNKYSPLYGAYVLTCSSDQIYVAYSKNHGQTWSSPLLINPKTQNGAVQGSQVSVGPKGNVYLAYEFFGSGNQRQHYLSAGTWSNGSLSFTAPFAVTPAFNDLTFSGCSTCTASYRVNSFPALAVSPATSINSAGNVYLVYGGQATSTSAAQVNFVACTSSCTGAKSFTSPSILNDVTAGDHFFPAIAVDSSGVIHSSWFDTRNNPSNPDYLDVYAAFLTYDAGTNSFTVSPNARVTPTTTDASELDGFGDTGFIGDYTGIAATAATPATAHPVWTNAAGILGILANGSLQTTTLTLPAGTP